MSFSSFRQLFKLLDKTLIPINVFLSLFRKTKLRHYPFKRIGIVKTGAMGDALCLMPSIRELKKLYPQAQIIWFTSPRANSALFASLPFIDKIESIPYSAKGILKLFFLILFHPVDIALDFDQYFELSELISFIWGRRNCCGYVTPLKGRLFAESIPYGPLKNEKLIFYDLASMLLKFPKGEHDQSFSPCIPELRLPPLKTEEVKIFLDTMRREKRPVVTVYPGSSLNAVFRRWGFDRFLSLANQLIEEGSAVVFVGGKDEEALKSKIGENLGRNKYFLNCIEKLPLEETITLIKNSDLFIGNDGGLFHVAETQGVPSIGIFGPTSSSKWGSLSPHSAIVETTLSCKPCIKTYMGEIPQKCKMGKAECLERIEPEDILQKSREFFAGFKKVNL
jgi:ADP-heptose:LPS heptosyltransferase